MSERLPRASLVLASLGLVACGLGLALSASAGGAPPGDVLILLPAVWLWTAAVLNRGEPGHAAYGVTTAAALALPASLGVLWIEYQRWLTKSPPGSMPLVLKTLVLAQFPIALTALVPSTIGWWQRRRELLADEPPEGP